jgi:hypothetical protein
MAEPLEGTEHPLHHRQTRDQPGLDLLPAALVLNPSASSIPSWALLSQGLLQPWPSLQSRLTVVLQDPATTLSVGNIKSDVGLQETLKAPATS